MSSELNNDKYIILIKLLILTRSVYSLKCWDCTTSDRLDPHSTEYCGENFNGYKLKQRAKQDNVLVDIDCSLERMKKMLNPNAVVFCQKLIIDVPNKTSTIVRSCSYGNLEADSYRNLADYKCNRFDHPYLSIPFPTRCQACTTDYCNASSSSNIIWNFLILSSFMFIFVVTV